jgi:hypothetical protein
MFDNVAGDLDKTSSNALTRFGTILLCFGPDRDLLSLYKLDPIWNQFTFDRDDLVFSQMETSCKVHDNLPYLVNLQDMSYVYFRDDGFDPRFTNTDGTPLSSKRLSGVPQVRPVDGG